MVEPLTARDLMDIALKGGEIPLERALATYADPDNWGMMYDEKGAHWVWKGPVICAYELAHLAFKYSKKE